MSNFLESGKWVKFPYVFYEVYLLDSLLEGG